MMRVASLLVLAWVAAFFVLSADCDGKNGDGCDKKEVQTTTFADPVVQTFIASTGDHDTFSCFPFLCSDLDYVLAFCDIDPDESFGEIGVGQQRWADFGTPPCNCAWWENCIYRGWVKFDLADLQGKVILGATMHWLGGGPCFAGSIFVAQHGPGDDEVALLSGAPVSLDTAWSIPPSSLDSSGGTAPLATVVAEWVNGSTPNAGLLFIGTNENTEVQGNLSCVEILSGFQLEVVFTD